METEKKAKYHELISSAIVFVLEIFFALDFVA